MVNCRSQSLDTVPGFFYNLIEQERARLLSKGWAFLAWARYYWGAKKCEMSGSNLHFVYFGYLYITFPYSYLCDILFPLEYFAEPEAFFVAILMVCLVALIVSALAILFGGVPKQLSLALPFSFQASEIIPVGERWIVSVLLLLTWTDYIYTGKDDLPNYLVRIPSLSLIYFPLAVGARACKLLPRN